MRIALRPSGGRGDYELAGSYGSLNVSDLLGKNFFFEVSPNLTIDGKSSVQRLSGKTRIRPKGGRHAYVIIAALLLMPPPRRELLKTSTGLPQLQAGTYAISGIDVDVLSATKNEVFFSPRELWLKSRGGIVKVDYAERMALISSLWNAASSSNSAIAKLIKNHHASAVSGDHDLIVASAAAIQKHCQSDADALPFLLGGFGLADASSVVYSSVSNSLDGFDSEDDDSTPEISRRERARKWRKQADRGPGAREFSVKVRQAYDYRCLFSGERFPKFPQIDSSGVDGAHILPWSTHQLNSVSNGLCLCKLCHWAFDTGLFSLDFDETANDYVLSISNDVVVGALSVNFDLASFKKLSGPIDKARLPQNHKLWPSPRYIKAFNAKL
jgi:putative restriction endonuclease